MFELQGKRVQYKKSTGGLLSWWVNFISASTAKLEHVADVVSVEATALLEGFKLVQISGCNNLMVRLDNSIVVQALNSNEGHSMVAAPVLQDCRLLSSIVLGNQT